MELCYLSQSCSTSQNSTHAQTAAAIQSPSNQAQLEADGTEPISIEVRYTAQDLNAAMELAASYYTQEDERRRPLPPSRLLLPWVNRASPDDLSEQLAEIPELKGGSWARGWKVFHDSQLGCAKCHTIHGAGATIGPDLSNLIHRDYTSVMRDVVQPSFAINPDYLTSMFLLDNGQVLIGSAKSIAGKLHINDSNGKSTVVDPAEVELIKPSSQSIMAEGLLKELSEQQIRDLMTFLLTTGPAMPRQQIGVPPPAPRSLAEVQEVLSGAPTAPQLWPALRVVLVAGTKDHGPGEHDYPAWLAAWEELFSIAENVQVVSAMEWPAADEFAQADVMVFYQRGNWNSERATQIDEFLSRGGGLSYIHWAVDGQQFAPQFAQRIGLAWDGASRFRHGHLTIDFDAESHPIARGFDVLKLVDESYWNLTGQLQPSSVLGTGIEDQQPQPLFWAVQRSRGRVFVSIPGHYSWTFDDPLFRTLLLRGIAWSAEQPVDRFNPLILPGANIAR